MVVFIPLQHGLTAKVSNEDEDLADVGWYASYKMKRQFMYVQRTSYKSVPSKTRSGSSLHGIILARMIGRPLKKGERTQFVDGNPLNCCRDNLKIVTYGQNVHSYPRAMSTNISGVKGVSYCPGRSATNPYHVRIKKDKINHYIGLFPTLEEAEEAYKEASIRLYGEHSPYWGEIAPAEGLTRGR